MYPWQKHPVAKYVTTLGQVDLWSDASPGRDILWPGVLLLQSVWPWSDVPPRQRQHLAMCVTTSVRLAFDQMFPLADNLSPSVLLLQSGWPWSDVSPTQRHLVAKHDTTLGQVDIFQIFRSGWPLGQMYPWQKHPVAMFVTTLGWVDLWSDVPLGRQLVAKCYYFSQVDLWSHVPPNTETSCGQVWYYFVSGWHFSDLQVRLTFRSDVPLAETSCGHVCYYFGLGWPLARCTPQQTSCGHMCYYFSQSDLWSDTPPGRDIMWPSKLLLQLGWLWSDVPPGRDNMQPSVLLPQSDWPLIRCTPWQTTCGQVLLLQSGWPLVRCTPQQRHLVAKCDTTLCQVDIFQIFRSGWPLGQMYAWQKHPVAMFVTTLGWVGLWSDAPPSRDIMWPHVLLLQSVWLLVRCTTQAETTCGHVCYYFSQNDLWSDVPLADNLWPSVLLLQSGWPLVRCTPKAETSCGQVWYYFGSGWQVDWRASLVPAAIVIAAPLAYIKVVAFKKLIFYLKDLLPVRVTI